MHKRMTSNERSIPSVVGGGQPIIAAAGAPLVAFGTVNGGPDSPASGKNSLTDGAPFAEECETTQNDGVRADFGMDVRHVSLVLIDFRADGGNQTGKTATLLAFNARGDTLASDSYTVTGDDARQIISKSVASLVSKSEIQNL